MNHQVVRYYLGWLLWILAALLFIPVIVAIIYQEPGFGNACLATISLCCLIALLMTFKPPRKNRVYVKEAMAITALGWFLISLLGCLPFVLSAEIPSLVDAFFETASGFTTTGSTILKSVAELSYSALFWRSFTHWVGGMGILVFMLAVLPTRSGSAINLLKAESPGPSVEKTVPRLKSSAMQLYAMYTVLTAVLVILLMIFGMDLFNALCIAFGTAGTGGFTVLPDGFDSYSLAAQSTVTIFMLVFAINFSFYGLLVKRKFKQAFKMHEVWVFLLIVLSAIIGICLVTRADFGSFYLMVHNVAFTVASIISTTGFATVDFVNWAPFALVILVLLMIVGACAGSTGGGFKVSRLIILFKGVQKEIHTLLHPRSVEKVKMDGKPIEHSVVRSVTIFFTLYCFVFAIAILLISIDGFDLVSTFTSVAATLNNIGPALGQFGPMSNFSAYSDFSKLVLSFCMIAGRLELLPVLILFTPSLWISRRHFRLRHLFKDKR